ncbi:MAG: dihydrolipoamide acetyltransferase family protein, partial [Bacteroidota bacterium]
TQPDVLNRCKKNMAQVEIIMPKMGESIMEATILRWTKKVGDPVAVDETLLEIATDKVDSEVPSPVAGVLSEILFQENDVVPVGKAIAVIATEGESVSPKPSPAVIDEPAHFSNGQQNGNGQQIRELEEISVGASMPEPIPTTSGSGRFYSPLVKNIAKTEGISLVELERLPGSGAEGRVTKKDILAYVETRSKGITEPKPPQPPKPEITPPGAPQPQPEIVPPSHPKPEIPSPGVPTTVPTRPEVPPSPAKDSLTGNVEIIEMDRMRKLIADHMVMSKHVSPHVTSFVEIDVTNLVNWRERVKGTFDKKYGEKITFTPIFIEAVVRAITDFPMVNVSVDGNRIIRKLDINIGMATALPSGNLIVPVIKNADRLNLVGLTKAVNDLAARARTNKLKPEEIQDGTFTLTNVGTFGNVMGTPIINQPQVAILAAGAIRKKPAVVETEYGDLIAVRQMMFLSLSYDHRVVDGALGGSFLRRVGDYLEAFEAKREV